MTRRFPPLLFALLLALAAGAVRAQSPEDAALPLPAPALVPALKLTAPGLRVRPGTLPGAPADGAARQRAPGGDEDSPVFIRADRIEGVAEKYFEAEGGVELRTRTETVRADWLRYDILADEIWGKGAVTLRHGIDWVTGPELRFKRDTEVGFFRDARFYIGENGGRGSAADLRFVGPDRYEVTDARYTTCAAPREDWYIRMEELEVDQLRKVGTGHHATLHFLGTPVVYTPWLEFPLSGERKSGFLTPILGSSVSRGFEFASPYYLNLAPDFDATLVPRYMTKRGLQLGGQFRYLRPESTGEINGALLYDDRETGTNRYSLSWKHNQSFPQVTGLAGYWNLNKVSDDTYFTDLSDSVAYTSQVSLPREAGLTWAQGPYSLLARVQAFQTLQVPGSPPATLPYDRLPQLLVNVNDAPWGGFDFGLAAEFASFRQPTRVEGDRVYAYPTVAWSRSGPWWFFKARGGVNLRYYSLEQSGNAATHPSVTLPIASLDAGLFFEREDSFFGQAFVQTLEPRAYYAYIPYRDQRALPNFDSALDDYNFAQLFTENRYLGYDRIGDANQLTLAATSRFLNASTGAEHLRIAVGQRFYFSDQQVTLNETPRSASSSDLLVGAEGRLSDVWSVVGLMQYNLDSGNTERFNFGGRYTPAPGRVVNATYSYTRDLVDPAGGSSILKQFDLSTQWPIAGSWSVLARWNYSLADSKTLEAVAGVEYNGDCWALRLVGQRLTTSTETTSTSVYAQIELNGLARFGTNPLELLRRTVPGYQKLNESAGSVQERGGDFNDF
ncbi:MAG: LPS-assembly protein LptD [Betaproteobacteria bacterium]|nr:LPS-assembly protein LptD [Betaproteobacteria bacterium]